MRWLCLLLIVLAACTVPLGPWERHQTQLASAEANGQSAQAMVEAHWLIDNALFEAPAAERQPQAEAARYIHLARLAAKAGRTKEAVEALRQALVEDPKQAGAIGGEIDRLPLPAERRNRLKEEFAWNSAALSPGYDGFDAPDQGPQCWSYRVREVRIRRQWTVRTTDGPQHQVTYDARPWRFDVGSGRWQAEGAWMAEAGTEVESEAGLQQPRYRAITTADHEFYADDRVPPCHRAGWQGPYDTNGTVFVADQLPATVPQGTK